MSGDRSLRGSSSRSDVIRRGRTRTGRLGAPTAPPPCSSAGSPSQRPRGSTCNARGGTGRERSSPPRPRPPTGSGWGAGARCRGIAPVPPGEARRPSQHWMGSRRPGGPATTRPFGGGSVRGSRRRRRLPGEPLAGLPRDDHRRPAELGDGAATGEEHRDLELVNDALELGPGRLVARRGGPEDSPGECRWPSLRARPPGRHPAPIGCPRSRPPEAPAGRPPGPTPGRGCPSPRTSCRSVPPGRRLGRPPGGIRRRRTTCRRYR